jgi:pimeloyl-ACP methyl ester carboxylesterase
MPYANNAGIRIRYEVEGAGPPLVLHHGAGGFLEFLYDIGLVEALRDDYQLILMDARGCGRSDKPHDPEAYSRALRAGDVVVVLDDLGLGRAHFMGYSMGGMIGWALAKYAPTRFHSLIIGGSGPPTIGVDEPNPGREQMIQLLRQGIEPWVAAMEEIFGDCWQPQWKDRLLASDVEALIAERSVWGRLGLDDVLPTLAVPCLIFVGEKDGSYLAAKKASEIIPSATFVSLPGLDHIGAGCQVDVVVPHIRKFLAQVDQSQ